MNVVSIGNDGGVDYVEIHMHDDEIAALRTQLANDGHDEGHWVGVAARMAAPARVVAIVASPSGARYRPAP